MILVVVRVVAPTVVQQRELLPHQSLLLLLYFCSLLVNHGSNLRQLPGQGQLAIFQVPATEEFEKPFQLR